MDSGLPLLDTSCCKISLLFAFMSLLFKSFFRHNDDHFKSIMKETKTTEFMYFSLIISFGCLAALCCGEFCYRLWLIYDKKQLEKNNLKCGIFSEEMKMMRPFGITCAGFVMGMGLYGKMEPIWLIVAVLWLFLRTNQMTDSLSNVNDILEERNSGIGQGRAKSYMEGFLDKLMKEGPERVAAEGSTIIGDKLKAHYENAMVMYQPKDEGYECRNEYVIFLPIDPTITKIEHLKNENQDLSIFRWPDDTVTRCDIRLDNTGSIRKSVCWIFKRKEDEARYWASKGKDRSGDKIYFVGDIPSELARDMRLPSAREEEKIRITKSFKKIIAESYPRKVLLFDVGQSQTRQVLSEVIRQKFKKVS